MQATFNTTIQLFLRLFRLNLKLESNLCRGFTPEKYSVDGVLNGPLVPLVGF